MEINEINAFVTACNEFIDGKFILADIKISKILRAISSSNDLYNLLAESLINYDFSKEFEKIKSANQAEHNGFMDLPSDNQVIVPFVFSLLVEIDSKHLDFSEFLSENFPMSNSQKEEYDSFAKHIILPFRNAIAQLFGVNVKDYPINEEEDEPHILDAIKTVDDVATALEENKQIAQPAPLTPEQENALLFDRIGRICGTLRDKLDLVRKIDVRSNLSLLINALIESCCLRNETIAVALIMSLNVIAKRERHLKGDIDQINSICYEFYK